MISDRGRKAFTLIEVLIVVVIMAVLAATIIPQFSSSTQDAKTSQTTFNTHTLRSQIELYRIHHGSYPTVDGFETAMTVKDETTGYGPYMDEVPDNPFADAAVANKVAATTSTSPASGDGSSGWQYNATTGGIWPNHATWTP